MGAADDETAGAGADIEDLDADMAPTQKLAPGTRTKAGSTPANRGGAPSSALVPPRPAQLPVQENMTSEEAQQMANELALSYVRFHRAEDEGRAQGASALDERERLWPLVCCRVVPVPQPRARRSGRLQSRSTTAR